MSKAMFELIKEDLSLLEDMLLNATKSKEESINEIARHVTLAGGKRLRPALALLSARTGQDYSREKILPLATALELIHTATLAHDDVIDGADTRRGVATLNAKWNNQVAILGGDYLFAKAFRLVAKENYDPYINYRIADLIGNLAEGEILQDAGTYTALRDISIYYERIKRKTADFLEVATELGGFVSGVTKTEQAALAAYGHAIGMAFQVTDDVLDMEETSESLGKPAANDLVSGIVTLPVIYALNNSKRSGELAAIVTDRHQTIEMAERAISIVRDSGGIEFAKKEAARFLNEAIDVLPDTIPKEVKQSFCMIADFIGKRNF